MAPFRTRRGFTLAGWALGLSTLAFALVLLDSDRLAAEHAEAVRLGQARVGADQLTGAALFTEARYAHHASQADRHAAFQDHPLALEHFPAGSLAPTPVLPPP